MNFFSLLIFIISILEPVVANTGNDDDAPQNPQQNRWDLSQPKNTGWLIDPQAYNPFYDIFRGSNVAEDGVYNIPGRGENHARSADLLQIGCLVNYLQRGHQITETEKYFSEYFKFSTVGFWFQVNQEIGDLLYKLYVDIIREAHSTILAEKSSHKLHTLKLVIRRTGIIGIIENRDAHEFFPFPLICRATINNKIVIFTLRSYKKQRLDNPNPEIELEFLSPCGPLPEGGTLPEDRLEFQIIGGYSGLRKTVEGFLLLRNNIINNTLDATTCNVMNALLQTAINSHVLQKSTELEDRKSFSLDSLRDFFECKSKPLVLVGPPGTGKTKTILDMIQVARAKGSFVFVVSPTYQALFAVLDKMIDDEYFSEDQYLLFTSRAEGCYPAKYRNHLISHSDFKEMEHTKLEPLQIILTTHLNIKLLMDHVNMKFRFQDNEKKQSYTTIIDEASKMPVADYFYYVNTMQSMNPEPDKHYVLVGDDHQLDPFSQLNGIDSTSVLSLFINMPDENRDLYFLDRCYRFSNPALRIVSTIFYNGLQITPSDSMKKTHIRWAHKTRNGHEQVGSSAKNEEEATQILQWLQHNPNLKSIAVISPYNAQIIRIQELLKTEHPYVECLSIDSAQGRDFDTVLVSLVESNRPFTQNVNRLDVAVTRAKKETVIFGSIPNEGTGLHRLYTSILEEEGIERNKRFPALAATCDNTSGAAAAAEAGAAARCRVIPRAGRAAEAANNFPDLGTYTPKSVHKSKSRCLVVEKKRS